MFRRAGQIAKPMRQQVQEEVGLAGLATFLLASLLAPLLALAEPLLLPFFYPGRQHVSNLQ